MRINRQGFQRALFAALATLAAACATGTANLGAVAASGASSGSGGAGGHVTVGEGGNITVGVGGGGGEDACPPEAKLVYLADYTSHLLGFDPSTLKVTDLGSFHCPGDAIPFSMAIDRTARAWISTKAGDIFTLDTTTLECNPTAFVAGQVDNFHEFGMAFVSDAPGSTSETLYLSSYADQGNGLGTGVGIAKLDTTTFQITPLGAYAMPGNAALTGTGDARLFGLFTWTWPVTAPPMLAQIDKGDSSVSNQDSVTLGGPSPWLTAMAFWGGDFYLFNDATAYKYTTATKTTTVAVATLGSYHIVGAAVSTCAPLTTPK